MSNLQPGTRIAQRFEVERRVGAGGMGAVYRARDVHTGEPVALKVMLEPERGDDGRFVREASALAALSHRAIVRYVAHGRTDEGAPWLAMEWLEGRDLAAELERAGPLEPARALALAAEMASALAVAHAAGLVHRDLKPANIFLPSAPGAPPKLLDFGIVRSGSATQVRTRTGSFLGTPGYIAPEQARGARHVGPAADVFSLGCVLFECLTGKPAFFAETVVATLARLLLEDAPRLREHRPDLPSELDALLAAMLDKDPARRTPDGAAVVRALAALPAVDAAPSEPREGGAPATRTGSGPRAALSPDEQQTVTVVLARLASANTDREPLDLAATLGAGDDDAPLAALRARLGRRAQVDRLADGSVVLTFAAALVATDRAAQAARAALVLRDSALGGPVAVATGRAVLGLRASLGEAIDRAAAVLARPPSGSGAAGVVLLDDVTADLLDGSFDVALEPGARVLRGERSAEQESRRLLGRETPFVGRERELAQLAALFDESAGEPMARLALVLGGPGMGKTRVRHEFLRAVRARGDEGLTRWASRGDPLRAESSYALLAGALRGAAALDDAAPREVQREALLAALEAWAPALGGDAGALGALLEVCGVGPAREHGVREALSHERVLGAVEALARGCCARGPLVWVLEDLHWGDRTTALLLEQLAPRLAEQPFFVLGLARPEVYERLPRLWAARDAQVVTLGPLPRRACEKLAQQVAGAEFTGERLRALVERAQGNAFFLEELLRAALQGSEALPATLVAMMQDRLAGLEPFERRVLRAASVYGASFWAEGLLPLLGAEADGAAALDDALAALERVELLSRAPSSRFAGLREYAVRHALVREAAYAMLTDEDRALGHGLAASWLEAAGEADPGVLAEHLARAGRVEAAAAQLLRCAERSLELGDYDGVERSAERARALLSSGPEGRALRERAVVLQCEAAHWLLDSASVRALVERHGSALEPGTGAWARVSMFALTACARLGLFDEVERRAAELEALPGRLAPHEEDGLRGLIAMQAYIDCRVALGDRMIAGLRGSPDGYLAAGDMALSTALFAGLAHAARVRGEHGRELAYSKRGLAAQVHVGLDRDAMYTRAVSCVALVEVGQFELAEEAIEEVLAFAARGKQARHRAAALDARALLRLHRAEPEGAIEAAHASFEYFARTGDLRRMARSRLYCARAELLRGRLGAAEECLGQVVAHGQFLRPSYSMLETAYGALALARGDVPRAARHADAIRSWFAQNGELGEGLPAARLFMAKAWLAAGRIDEASAHVRRASAEHERVLAELPDATWRARAFERITYFAELRALAEQLR